MKRQLTTATVALLAFCAGGIMSFFTLPIWIIPWVEFVQKGEKSDWIGFVGAIISSFITSAVAAIAIYFAAAGIRQQIRVPLLGREEDRIVRELPGLRAAETLLRRFLAEFGHPQSFAGLDQGLAHFGLHYPDPIFDQEIRSMLPDTDDATLVQVRHCIREACAEATGAQNALTSAQFGRMRVTGAHPWDPPSLREIEGQIASMDRDYSDHRRRYALAIEAVGVCASGIAAKLTLLQNRLIDVRRETTEFFRRR